MVAIIGRFSPDRLKARLAFNLFPCESLSIKMWKILRRLLAQFASATQEKKREID